MGNQNRNPDPSRETQNSEQITEDKANKKQLQEIENPSNHKKDWKKEMK
jgi:hypothetical protein